MLFKIKSAIAIACKQGWAENPETGECSPILCPDGSVQDPAIGCIETPGGVIDPNESLFSLILKVADFLTLIAGSIAIIMLLVAGIKYALAMGDDDKISQAKETMKWSIIGLVISISAYLIIEFILSQIV